MPRIITEDQIRSLTVVNTDELEKDLQQAENICTQLREFLSDVQVSYTVSENTDDIYYSSSRICFSRDGVPFFIPLTKEYGKYPIKVDWEQLKHFRVYDLPHSTDTQEPPGIRSGFTEAKVGAWLDFHSERFHRAKKLNDERAEQIRLFLLRLRQMKGVHWDNHRGKSEISGHVDRNGIRMHFTQQYSGFSLRFEVRVPNKNETLDTFLELSDNRYRE